eukprot:scaffold284078_cov19-Tisochrysis_lutea.AAC.3
MHDEVPSGFVSSLPAVRCISFIKTMHGAYLGCAYKMEFVMRLELPEPACMHAKLVQVANKECMHAVVGSPTLTRKCKLNARPKFWMHADIKLLVQNLNIDSRLCNLRSDMLWGHVYRLNKNTPLLRGWHKEQERYSSWAQNATHLALGLSLQTASLLKLGAEISCALLCLLQLGSELLLCAP